MIPYNPFFFRTSYGRFISFQKISFSIKKFRNKNLCYMNTTLALSDFNTKYSKTLTFLIFYLDSNLLNILS